MHTSNTDHDETIKEQIKDILRMPHNKKPERFSIATQIRNEQLGLIMNLVKEDRERAVREALIDELEHMHPASDYVSKGIAIPAFERLYQLSNPTQEKEGMNDETLKEQVEEFLVWVMANRDIHSRVWADTIEPALRTKLMQLILQDRERAVNAGRIEELKQLITLNKTLYGVEAEMTRRANNRLAELSNPTQEKEQSAKIAHSTILIDEDRFDKLSTMQLEALADYHYKSLVKLQEMLKNPTQEKGKE